MTETNDARYQAWLDGLPQAQLELVQRIEEMPPGMAIAYVFVELDAKIAALQRPLWKQALTPVSLAGAFIAGFLGPDAPRLGG